MDLNLCLSFTNVQFFMTVQKGPANKIPIIYIIFLIGVLSIWGIYMYQSNRYDVFSKHWAAVLTMIFGSFVAGSSPEGSAAIAYPIFTLLLKIEPSVARNFAFAIQSIGMTAASLLIIGLKIKVETNYIKYVSLGGIFGLIAGTYFIVPLISPPLAKLFFVSLWLSFGLVLWRKNSKSERYVFDKIIPFTQDDRIKLIFFGIIGGCISAVFGTGINIFTFCLMTIYYNIDEKVAVPSSVIIMTIETMLGFFLHAQVLQDFQQESFEMWLACIPFVIFFAPLGAYLINKLPRHWVATFIYLILVIQFIGAFWVLRPEGLHLWISLATIIFGILFFAFIATLKRK